MEIILVYLDIGGLFYGFCRDSICIWWKKKIISNKSKEWECYSKKLSNGLYMNIVMSEFIYMNFGYNKKSKYKNQENRINRKSEPEHMYRNKNIK